MAWLLLRLASRKPGQAYRKDPVRIVLWHRTIRRTAWAQEILPYVGMTALMGFFALLCGLCDFAVNLFSRIAIA